MLISLGTLCFLKTCSDLRINGNFHWRLLCLHSDMKSFSSKCCKILVTSNTAFPRTDLSVELMGSSMMCCSEASQWPCVSEPRIGRASRLLRPHSCQTPSWGPCRRKLGVGPTLQGRPHGVLGHRRGRAAHSSAVSNAPVATALLSASPSVLPGVSRASSSVILTEILFILPHQFC